MPILPIDIILLNFYKFFGSLQVMNLLNSNGEMELLRNGYYYSIELVIILKYEIIN